jgi:diguanylate cyclase (GGDEF)-like protein/PAS domain S-box-containing protein/putative nucleotidyltransferase with HDIG domain
VNALDLLSALPAMLWTARADGVWTHVNRRWAAFTGMQGESSGFGFEAALHPDDVAPTVARWTQSVHTGQPYQAEYRVRRHDGQYRWFLTHGVHTPHLDADVVWTGTCTDIHDQKLAEREADIARQSAVRALGLALETRDHETKGHTDRVTRLALRLGAQAGLNPADLDTLRIGAYLHDIGKMSVPDAILLKPGPLTPAERLTMQEHVTAGERFAASLGFLDDGVLQVIRAHHERWDGSGYPLGLRGTGIPLLARIFALADVYDALLSERPYKRAWSPQQAQAEIGAQAGKQFDPQLTALLLALLSEVVQAGEQEAREDAREEDAGEEDAGEEDAGEEDAGEGDTGAALPSVLPEPSAGFWTTASFSAADEQVRAVALHEAAMSVLITDAEQRLLYVNSAFCRVTGYRSEEVLGRNPRFLQGPNTDPESQRALREAITAGKSVRQMILNYSKSGEELWFDMYITPVFLQGQLKYFLALQIDSSEWVADHDHLHHLATHDPLTGLMNRLSLASALPPHHGESRALIVLDLDNLKGVNDRYGHLTGDRVLRSVAHTLLTHVPANAQVYRLGGDEFLVMLPVQHEQEALVCISRLQTALDAADALGPVETTPDKTKTTGAGSAHRESTGTGRMTASFGTAFYPREGTELWPLLGLADARMYANKAGKMPRRSGIDRGVGSGVDSGALTEATDTP